MEFDHIINSAIKRLRQALSDDADTPRSLETLPRRGYRFIYPVDGAAAVVPPPSAPLRLGCLREVGPQARVPATRWH